MLRTQRSNSGIKWDQDQLTRWPPKRSKDGRGRFAQWHPPACACAKCEGVRAVSRKDLLRRIPLLCERLGEQVPWNLQTMPFNALYAWFARLNLTYREKVEAGELSHT